MLDEHDYKQLKYEIDVHAKKVALEQFQKRKAAIIEKLNDVSSVRKS